MSFASYIWIRVDDYSFSILNLNPLGALSVWHPTSGSEWVLIRLASYIWIRVDSYPFGTYIWIRVNPYPFDIRIRMEGYEK